LIFGHVAVVNPKSIDTIYVFGGKRVDDLSKKVSNALMDSSDFVRAFSTAFLEWTPVKTSGEPPAPRYQFICENAGENNMLLFGGATALGSKKFANEWLFMLTLRLERKGPGWRSYRKSYGFVKEIEEKSSHGEDDLLSQMEIQRLPRTIQLKLRAWYTGLNLLLQCLMFTKKHMLIGPNVFLFFCFCV
jgi:hypothetical protein